MECHGYFNVFAQICDINNLVKINDNKKIEILDNSIAWLLCVFT